MSDPSGAPMKTGAGSGWCVATWATSERVTETVAPDGSSGRASNL
eukprot:CAMPEP_0204352358 /NCGR_PEP_ID=MMETSP0469-20131031/31831_1 /ASSEMBLY_ACC=CAM_ASM_000384 /TAXON_ID=2969 /ORGANISM="Oxyrrhis marina" /LENGTH=44 /DNA_ID= /DNA_START= /DNA_END= /DNA_ORIENTATION=